MKILQDYQTFNPSKEKNDIDQLKVEITNIKKHSEFVSESVLKELGTGIEVVYLKKDGKPATKKIHRIDYQNAIIYFLNSKKIEFGKNIDQIISIK